MANQFAKAKAFVVGAVRLYQGTRAYPHDDAQHRRTVKRKQCAACLCATAVALVSLSATAATTSPTYAEEYSNIVNRAQTQALGSDLFGERINLSNGSTEFTATDVAVKTNGQIPLTFGRKLVVNAQANYGGVNNPTSEILGRFWQVDVPYMRGTFPQQLGWVGSNFSAQRCTYGIMPPSPVYGVGPFHNVPYENNIYWTGTTINVPGQGEEDLLTLPAGRPQPIDGRTYSGATKSEWRVACLPSIKNGSGEGFIAALPDGTKYYFDWIAKRSTAGLVDTYCHQDNGLSCYTGIALYRDEVFLYATKAEDRFGNSITYSYDANNPHRLLSIASSDGASIQLGYNGIGKISTVTTAGRTWSYTYSGDANTGMLSSVAPPDNNSWSYQYNNLYDLTHIEARYLWEGCDIHVGTKTSSVSPGPGETASIVMTHPSGARGEFLFRKLIHGSNRTPGSCTMLHPGDSPDATKFPAVGPVPSVYQIGSIYSKKITGPGLDPIVWTYKYAPTWSFSSECNPSCASSSQTFVTGPDSVKTTYTFGNDYINNFGQLLSTRVEKSGTVYSDSAHTYVTTAQGQPFPDSIANDSNWRTNKFLLKFRPLKQRQIVQQGTTFTWQANSFDGFANPLSITRSSTLGYTRTDVTAYHHNTAKWVIGQIASSTNSDTGLVESKTDYDANALPWKTWAFGKLQQTLAYNADGTLLTAKDGKNNTTAFTSWKRGIPQKVTFADAEFKTAVVNDLGEIDSVTDENGYATKYDYDAMGRLKTIDYPDADSVNWNNTNISFVPVAGSEYGIAAGHWRRTVSTGNGRQIAYFDALWRPLVEVRYDATSDATTTATVSAVVKHYDAQGRQTFQGYPRSTLGNYADPALKGIDTAYDALGRVLTVKQDSELGVLTTTNEYLNGLQIRVTNPRGFKTTTGYMAYDQPSTDSPVQIIHPEGAYTNIYRDVFGKPTSILRHNADNTDWNRRYFAYDANQQICKTTEVETGTTAYGYDAAGNLTWSAAGLPWSPSTPCEYTANDAYVAPLRVDRTYDVRNRLKTLAFPDGLGDQAWTYTPDGLPEQIIAYNAANHTVPVVTAYQYNKRRLLNGQGETVTQPDWYSWGIGYGYNANGHLASHAYPSGLTITYAPNALGQPTQVGTYATGVSYHPNGAIAQFTYGNGLTHTLTQNARGLPDTSCDFYTSCNVSNLLNDGYDYDANGNVAAISDGTSGNGGDRTMSYDGLDRLIGVVSPMYGSAGAMYRYDTLDNLTRVRVGGPATRDHWYCYDDRQQLTNVKTGDCQGESVIGLGYDARGNLDNKNGATYDFDYGNRLRGVAHAGTYVETYRYDGLGRRVHGWSPTLGNIFSQYSHDGRLMYQNDGRRDARIDYLYLGGSLVAARERAEGTGAVTVKYYHTDALGTPVAVTDAARTHVQESQYEPYGKLINRPLSDGPGYTGHVADAQTGLIYAQQRYYDDDIGRFLSVDPVTADSVGGNFNRYWYANNNPYRFIDPDGRSSCSDQNQTCPGKGAWQVFKGMMIGMLDSMMADAHYSSPNPMVEMYPGELSPANQCNCDYRSPFGAAANNEEQLGRDLAPAAAIAFGFITKSPSSLKGASRVKPPLQTPKRIIVDSRGNAIPLNRGEYVTGSPDGRWIQVRDANGNPTGMRIDGPHGPRTHSDPRALQPHGHVPGVTNQDGTPWLPIK